MHIFECNLLNKLRTFFEQNPDWNFD